MTFPRLLVIAILLVASVSNGADLTATIGKQSVVMADEQFGLRYFPDQPVCILSQQPLRFFLVAGDKTVLMEGRSLETAELVKTVLEPSKQSGSYDEQYSGVNSVFMNKDRKEILAFFHAEKPTGGRDKEGTFRFYASIGLAVSNDGTTLNKVGPILTGRPQDPNWMGTAQGNAEPSVCLDHTGKWLYLYYTEHSQKDAATGKSRGVITCMARSKVEDGARPGTWKKFYKGSFSEPGLGGKDSEIANCYAASVTYIPAMKKYIMVASRGCVGYYTSDDGIKWSNPTILFKLDDVPIIDKEIAIHPSLHIERATATEASGLLMYGYSPKYGHDSPNSPHFLVKRPITFKATAVVSTEEPPKKKIDGSGDTDGLKKKLAGTTWVNTRQVLFEWTKDGRFRHNGNDVPWKVIGPGKVEVVLNADRIDTLVFNDSFTEFKQLIKGGPDSYDGKLMKQPK
ncbi:MAG: hypothetical protein ACKVP0_01885 [Pirellulaceae bacterium]